MKHLNHNYVQNTTDLLYNKYFYKQLLEKKYLETFGELELLKKENIYKTMVLNRKLEESFMSELSGSVPESNLIEYKARKEFYDLERQVIELKSNLDVNTKSLQELEFFEQKQIKHKIQAIIEKTSPYLNKSGKAMDLWRQFQQSLYSSNWKRIFRLAHQTSNMRRVNPKISESVLTKQIEKQNEELKSIKNRYPFTMIDVLMSDERIEKRKNKEIKDLKNIQESYERMTDVYLSTNNPSGLYS